MIHQIGFIAMIHIHGPFAPGAIYSISYTTWEGSVESARRLSERHASERSRSTQAMDWRFGPLPALLSLCVGRAAPVHPQPCAPSSPGLPCP